MSTSRCDDYEERRKHLKGLTEEELEQRFWELTDKIVSPMIELAKKNTSPSIERSVLLRMGFSSLEAKEIVNGVINRDLMGKGAGNVVYRASKINNLELREAGLKLAEGEEDIWNSVITSFKGGSKL